MESIKRFFVFYIWSLSYLVDSDILSLIKPIFIQFFLSNNFSSMNLINVELDNVIINFADFSGALFSVITNSEFRICNLSNTTIRTITKSKFAICKFYDSCLYNITDSNFTCSYFIRSNFIHSTINNTIFNEGSFEQANFTYATMKRGGFIKLNFDQISFMSVNFWLVDFVLIDFNTTKSNNESVYDMCYYTNVQFVLRDFPGKFIHRVSNEFDSDLQSIMWYNDEIYVTQARYVDNIQK